MRPHITASSNPTLLIAISCCRPLALLLVFCWLFASGCAAGALPEDDGVATVVFEGPVARDCPLLDEPSWLGFAQAGQIVRFDGRTGAIDAWVESASPSDADGLRDLAVDCEGRRVAVYREVGDQGGVLGEHSLHPDGFGAWHLRAQVDGWMRSTPLHGGLLAFEVGYGERWRVLPDEGVPTASTPLPVPRSLWLSPDGGSLDALVLRPTSPASLSWIRAALHPDGFDVQADAPLAWGDRSALESIRATRRRDGMLIARAHDGELELTQLSPGRDPEPLLTAPVGAGQVEQIVALEPHAYQDRFWILLREPAALLAVSLEHLATARVPVAGNVLGEQPFFSRALAVHGQRAWVATDAGVHAFDWLGDEEPSVVADPRFEGGALLGPLAGPVEPGRGR